MPICYCRSKNCIENEYHLVLVCPEYTIFTWLLLLMAKCNYIMFFTTWKNLKCFYKKKMFILFQMGLIDWCLTVALFFSNGSWRDIYHILLIDKQVNNCLYLIILWHVILLLQYCACLWKWKLFVLNLWSFSLSPNFIERNK